MSLLIALLVALTAPPAAAATRTDVRREPLEIHFQIRLRERTDPIDLRLTWTPAAPGKVANQTRLYDSRTPEIVRGGSKVVPFLRTEMLERERLLSSWPAKLADPSPECREKAELTVRQAKTARSWLACIDPEIKDSRSARIRSWIQFVESTVRKGLSD